MSPFSRCFVALALLAVAGPAAAFTRETTITGAPGEGTCLWWGGRQVTYHVNATSTNVTPCGGLTAAGDAIEAAMATWAGATRAGEASPCTNFRLERGPDTTAIATGRDGVNLIVFRKSRCADVAGTDPCRNTPGACGSKFNCWDDTYGLGTVGLTTTSRSGSTGQITDSDMELFNWDGNANPRIGHYFTCQASNATCSTFGEANCTGTDLQAVVTHEAGHMFGLDHVCAASGVYHPCVDPASVMVPNVGNILQRTLAPDDVNGICTIYPAAGPTSTCPPVGDGGGATGGCSSSGQSLPVAFALLLTLFGFRRRWRRA